METYSPWRTQAEIEEILHAIGGGYGAGSDYPPYTEDWAKALSAGVGLKFRDGLSVIDLGCGYGRFLNYLFISGIQKFRYYGLEVPAATGGSSYGNVLVSHNKEKYECANSADKKISFGLTDDESLVDEAIENCNTLLLGSVFTHLSIEDSIVILERYSSLIAKENGSVVFTLIMGKHYRCRGGSSKRNYHDDNYAVVTHTSEEVRKLTLNGKYVIKKIEDFQTDHELVHAIYELTERQE